MNKQVSIANAVSFFNGHVDDSAHHIGADIHVLLGFDLTIRGNGLCEVLPDDPEKIAEIITRLEAEMREAAKKFEFERAAELRDKARELRAKVL